VKKRIIFFLICILAIYIWKDYKKIDFGYVNQNKITYNFKNLDNNFLKKTHIFINTKIENYLIANNSEHKNYWDIKNTNLRDELPKYKFKKKATIFTPNKANYSYNTDNWLRSHGNDYSDRFSNLKLINKDNAKNLSVAWTFLADDIQDVQANPIVADGVIYTPVSGGHIAAINGSNGKLIWKSSHYGKFAARRGLIYWSGKDDNSNRIIFSNRQKLISLNAKDGKEIKSFGNNGKVRTGLNVMTPVIYKGNIIIASWDHAIEAYDLQSGQIKWKIKFKKKIKGRNGGVNYNNKGANPWSGVSLDRQRGLLFITTGNPHAYFDGTRRPGENKYSNSIIAINLNDKKILWDFQETSHDIWNHDISGIPILTKIKKNGHFIDVVVTPTKLANTIILDRLTGLPIFDFRLRKAPSSNVPGEKTSNYQPNLDLPEPFGRNIFLTDHLWSLDEKKTEKLIKRYSNHNYGFFEPYELNKKTLQYNFHGGAEWMGGAVDQINNIMFVTSNNILWETELVLDNKKGRLAPLYSSKFKRVLTNLGYPAIKPPWGTLTALDLNNGKIIWQSPFGEYKELTKKGVPMTGTENFGGATVTSGNIVIATGTLDKKIYIFNAINGNIIFDLELPYIGSAPPTTYMSDGEQYILVHATGGWSLSKGYPDLVQEGNALVALKLKDL
jgi:quinoprotein glucose dehydrogenase